MVCLGNALSSDRLSTNKQVQLPPSLLLKLLLHMPLNNGIEDIICVTERVYY